MNFWDPHIFAQGWNIECQCERDAIDARFRILFGQGLGMPQWGYEGGAKKMLAILYQEDIRIPSVYSIQIHEIIFFARLKPRFVESPRLRLI